MNSHSFVSLDDSQVGLNQMKKNSINAWGLRCDFGTLMHGEQVIEWKIETEHSLCETVLEL